jgi:glycosyltransferase involved in cell wall biosynthesis
MHAERWLSRSLVRYVAVSDQLAEAVHRHERIPRERLAVIPNGVADLPPADAGEVAALRTALVGARPGPVVGVAARLVWEKGLDVLLRAWAARRAAPAERGTLVLAGEGPERSALERLVKELGIGDSVVLPGTITRVACFYRMLDLFVLSSVSEGLPMALLEAMAAGLPIVATRVGGMPAALDDGAAGVLVEPSDAQGLARAFDVLLSGAGTIHVNGTSAFRMPANAIALGATARQRFEHLYTARAMTSRYEAYYSPHSQSV